MRKIELLENKTKQAKAILSKYKTFAAFSKNKIDAYAFTNLVGLKVCPYCNIEYVYTVYDKKNEPVVRPDIDHFIPKNSQTGNPALQLEFTNLVPSCFICNERLKGKKAFSRVKYIHPYEDDFDSIMIFHVELHDLNYLSEDNFELYFSQAECAVASDVKRAFNSIKVFKLNERYAFHKNEVVMLFKRMQYYTQSKNNEISSLVGIPLSKESMVLPEKYCDINSTSLGKLKRDVIRNYS